MFICHERGTKKNVWVRDENRTHGLPDTGWELYIPFLTEKVNFYFFRTPSIENGSLFTYVYSRDAASLLLRAVYDPLHKYHASMK